MLDCRNDQSGLADVLSTSASRDRWLVPSLGFNQQQRCASDIYDPDAVHELWGVRLDMGFLEHIATYTEPPSENTEQFIDEEQPRVVLVRTAVRVHLGERVALRPR